MKPDNRNEIKRKLDKDFKQEIKTQVKDQIIKLKDTRGNFSMGIKLPSKDYKPRKSYDRAQNLNSSTNTSSVPEPLTKEEKNRWYVKQYYQEHPDKLKEHYEYIKNWRKRNQYRIKQHARIWFIENGKQYYEDNKPRLLRNQKNYYYRNKKQQEGYRITKHGVGS